MRIIELRSDRADFPRMLADIREWLNRNDRPLVRFETEPEEGNALTIKVQFEANDLAGANNNLKAFIAEVAGVSCEDVSCRGNQPSTSEAYAVLYFNGKYVSDRLP